MLSMQANGVRQVRAKPAEPKTKARVDPQRMDVNNTLAMDLARAAKHGDPAPELAVAEQIVKQAIAEDKTRVFLQATMGNDAYGLVNSAWQQTVQTCGVRINLLVQSQ